MNVDSYPIYLKCLLSALLYDYKLCAYRDRKILPYFYNCRASLGSNYGDYRINTFPSLQVSILFSFFVPTGLGDHSEEVRVEMLNAALTAVNHLGKVKKCCSYVKYV